MTTQEFNDGINEARRVVSGLPEWKKSDLIMSSKSTNSEPRQPVLPTPKTHEIK